MLDILAEQTHEVAGCVRVDAQRRGDDVSRSVSPVLVIVLGSIQDGVSYCGLCMHRLPCTGREQKRQRSIAAPPPRLLHHPKSPCILAAAIMSPADMLDTFTR